MHAILPHLRARTARLPAMASFTPVLRSTASRRLLVSLAAGLLIGLLLALLVAGPLAWLAGIAAMAVTFLVTGLVGVFSDPGHVIRSCQGEVRQQFALVLRARAVGGVPHGDLTETSAAAWVPVAELRHLTVEEPTRLWIAASLAPGDAPHLG